MYGGADMVVWINHPEGKSQTDCYSIDEVAPPTDTRANDWVTTFTSNDSYTEFTSDRLLDTGDS